MSLRSAPDSPSSSRDAADDPGRTSTVCCWSNDYWKEISINPCGRYFHHYQSDGAEHTYNWQRNYKIIVPAASGNTITVVIRCRSEQGPGVEDFEFASTLRRMELGVNELWNGIFTINCSDPAEECPVKSFAVHYQIEWVRRNAHYTVKVHMDYPRCALNGYDLDVSLNTSRWTLAHEFGHCVGLPDEYSYTPHMESLRYRRPDGSLGPIIFAPANGKPADAPDATIMAAVNNTTVLERHGWQIAIEVQELLRDEIGREITCAVSV